MLSIPIGIATFILGLMVGLISYIWGTLTLKIGRLEKKVETLPLAKCQACEPITIQQLKDLFDMRFNEFRLELYKGGVLKAPSKTKTK